ncbi:hypothetical protein LCGC14_0804780 [marine sediment metagenome]|uniref:Uncharacterized protein n=1 Tax=marine sediment metagenome TaxID=412755 RepID=A0A0F9PNK0_9ZZZZ
MSEFEEYKQKVNLVLKKFSDRIKSQDKKLDVLVIILDKLAELLPSMGEMKYLYDTIKKALMDPIEKASSKEILDHKENLEDLKNTLLNETIPHITNELQELEGAENDE